MTVCVLVILEVCFSTRELLSVPACEEEGTGVCVLVLYCRIIEL